MSNSLALAHKAAKMLPVSTFVHMLDEDDFGRPLPNVSPMFNSSTADLILSSCDSSHFKVHRAILAEASPIFYAALFDLPEKQATEPPPIQELAENGETVTKLLQFIYPVPNPVITNLTELRPTLQAASKYEIFSAVEGLKALLLSKEFLWADPLGVYSLACEFGFDEEAKRASSATLSIDILSVPLETPYLARITAQDFLKLVRLHKTRAAAAIAILECMSPMPHGCCGQPDQVPIFSFEPSFPMNDLNLFPTGLPPAPPRRSKHRQPELDQAPSTYVRWWITWKEAATKELEARPTSTAVFAPSYLLSHVKRAARHCSQCAPTYMSSATQTWIAMLKERIDALPDTI